MTAGAEVISSGASRALRAIVDALAAHGIDSTADAGAFYPQPVGVLVGLPALEGRNLATATYVVAVRVVSGDPMNSLVAVDRLYALADDVAEALAIDRYVPGAWQGGVNMEPLPAVEMAATITLTYLPERVEPHEPTEETE